MLGSRIEDPGEQTGTGTRLLGTYPSPTVKGISSPETKHRQEGAQEADLAGQCLWKTKARGVLHWGLEGPSVFSHLTLGHRWSSSSNTLMSLQSTPRSFPMLFMASWTPTLPSGSRQSRWVWPCPECPPLVFQGMEGGSPGHRGLGFSL